MNQDDTWKFAAFGKHPAAKDFIKLGTDTSILDGFADWVENGYAKLVSKSELSAPEFCSWRFWTKGSGQPEQEHKSRANDVLCRIARMDMAEALLMNISKGEDIWLRTRQ